MDSSGFVHHANDDGIMDSICKACLATIASSMWEADLERAEAAHVCAASGLQSVNEIAVNSLHSAVPEPR